MTGGVRTGNLLNVQQTAQRHHSAGIVASIHSLNLARIRLEIGVTPQIDLKRTAQEVKVIYIVRAKIALERGENGVQRDIQRRSSISSWNPPAFPNPRIAGGRIAITKAPGEQQTPAAP
jgi:hypothetical protein